MWEQQRSITHFQQFLFKTHPVYKWCLQTGPFLRTYKIHNFYTASNCSHKEFKLFLVINVVITWLFQMFLKSVHSFHELNKKVGISWNKTNLAIYCKIPTANEIGYSWNKVRRNIVVILESIQSYHIWKKSACVWQRVGRMLRNNVVFSIITLD